MRFRLLKDLRKNGLLSISYVNQIGDCPLLDFACLLTVLTLWSAWAGRQVVLPFAMPNKNLAVNFLRQTNEIPQLPLIETTPAESQRIRNDKRSKCRESCISSPQPRVKLLQLYCSRFCPSSVTYAAMQMNYGFVDEVNTLLQCSENTVSRPCKLATVGLHNVSGSRATDPWCRKARSYPSGRSHL
jgi:hypothetical protein